MERWSGRVVIVTGASSGIGAALVERLVKCGVKVVGCARHIQPIENLCVKLNGENGSLLAVKCDVTNEDEVLSLIERTREHFGGVDVCINNAGVAHTATFLSGTTENWKDMTNVNIMGVAMVTREAVKDMRSRGVNDGHIININSLSGHRVSGTSGPGLNFYRMTKYAMTAMTECIRGELRKMKTKIRISQVSLGLTKTDIYQKIAGVSEEEAERYYSSRPHLGIGDIVDAVIYQLSAPPSVEVNDIIIRATQQVA
ncbi:hypothetical protein LSH36_918g00016 [Paralvinella palmiformis]|uniref:Dehydrogenase/reductase SDR family member 11 n=1 Tax=Paralvinella palmiformis TaxID=53620 RepID=A0AAD9MT10_9ANNE|nr:hypothetical protein LSH36_918g00016 [Paralvinella palmiformis]